MSTCRACGEERELITYTRRHECRSCYNQRMSQYMLARYHRRRTEAIEELGGRCNICGGTEDLELDHIDRTQKSFSISKVLVSAPEKRYKEELRKCQVLCKLHHQLKTSQEQSVGHGEGLTGKKYCYCTLCAPVKRQYQNEWRLKNGRKKTPTVGA